MGGDGEQLDDLKEQGGNYGPRDIAFPTARSVPTCTVVSSRDPVTCRQRFFLSSEFCLLVARVT